MSVIREGRRYWFALLVGAMLLMPMVAFAHCDTLDGPVVADARAAVNTGNVTPVLKWVRMEDTATITTAFNQTLAVRKLSTEAKHLADNFFFETLVRIHRAGEGAPYTGIKPAGTVDPIIVTADKAIADGKADPLVAEVTAIVARGIRTRLARVIEARKHINDSVEAGRAYVASYVEYVHYIEALHQAVAGAAGHTEKATCAPEEHGHGAAK